MGECEQYAGPEASGLLAWYDAHGRDLPWRAKGYPANPFHVWLSEIMLQQTTVAAVIPYYTKFLSRWPSLKALAAASQEEVLAEWAGLGYYSRGRNLLKCARILVEKYGGGFPQESSQLQELPGIGPYTAAAIAAIAFDRSSTVVDGNVERVMARYFAVEAPLPQARAELKAYAAKLTPAHRPGDYAQAVMDLGAIICTPRHPKCADCPWHEGCAGRKAGNAATLPRRQPKKPRPVRYGFACVDFAGDRVRLERRPERGMLAGTLAVPGSTWSESLPPIPEGWQKVGEVRHVFTHFALVLSVLYREGDRSTGAFYELAEVFTTLPSLDKKVLALAQERFKEG